MVYRKQTGANQMRRLTGLALLLMSASQASACHHYSIWTYPYRQSCKTTTGLSARVDRSWYVEFVLPTDDRAAAIEELKRQMK